MTTTVEDAAGLRVLQAPRPTNPVRSGQRMGLHDMARELHFLLWGTDITLLPSDSAFVREVGVKYVLFAILWVRRIDRWGWRRECYEPTPPAHKVHSMLSRQLCAVNIIF